MKAFVVMFALLAPSLALADGFGYQGDDSSSDGFGYQTAPDWGWNSTVPDYNANDPLPYDGD